MAMTKKGWGIFLSSLLCAGTLVAAVACGGSDPETKYVVTYLAGAADAAGSVAEGSYKEGTPITLRDVDTFTRDGYAFTKWSDGTTLYDAGETFFMPANDVAFTAQWEALPPQAAPEDAEQVSEIPVGSLVTTNGAAKANWFAEYTAQGFKITAWVQDAHVYTDGNIYSNDGVEVIFSSVTRSTSYTEQTLSVLVSADGTSLVKNMATGGKAEIEGLTASAKIITLDGATVAGYRAEITVPYAAAGISQEDKNAAVALGVTNASNAGNARLVYETSLGTEINRLNTFISVKNDNTFAASPYLELGLFWGNGGSLAAKSSWNLEFDDGTADAYISMTGLDGDNNIYMRNTNLSEYYAEVRIHANELRNNEKFAKFGLTVFKTDGSGFLYFIDARANDGKNFDAASTNLGYVSHNGSAWQWPEKIIGNLGDGVTSDAYAGEDNFVTLGIYRYNNNFQFYVGNKALEVLTLDNYTVASYAGLASFNVLISAKGYSVKTTELAIYRETLEETLNKEPDQPVASNKTIDGSLSDWTAAEKTNPFVLPAAEGKSVTVYASKDDKGVNIFYDIHHKEHKTEEGEWFKNTNVEFYLGGGTKQFYVSANGAFGGVAEGNFFMHTEEETGGYHTVVETFVPYSELSGYNANSATVPARFLFKVGGYNGNVWYTGDWWRTDENNATQGILVTANGIKAGTMKTIDGSDADWAGAGFTSSGRSQWAASLEDDGLYLIIKLTGTISNERAFFCGADDTPNNWWLNQNIEIQDSTGLKAAKIVYLNGETYYTAFVNDAAAKYTAGTGNADDSLVFEIFIARENFKDSSAKELKVKIGGQLFADATSDANVWQTYLNDVTVRYTQYTVTYQYNNGSENTSVTVFKGDSVTSLPVPEKEGFTFDGWYDGTTKAAAPFSPTADVTLSAKWNPVAPVINWNKGNAEASGNDPTTAPVWDAEQEKYTLALPAASPYMFTGHTFSKWSVSEEGVSGSAQYNPGDTIEIAAGSTITVTAVWVTEGVTTYTVSFALGYADAPAYNETRTVEEGETVADLPTNPVRTGYRFDGWLMADNTTKFTTSTEVTADITVTAHWVQQVTVTFALGYEGTAPAAITTDLGTTISVPEVTRNYFSFEGWFFGANNAAQLTAETQITENITATAKWTHQGEKDVTYFFLGASTISKDFWYTYGGQFTDANSANLGVPGTKVEDWIDKITTDDVLQYNATNIILHIGLNNVNDGQESDEKVIERLTALFAGLKEIYPNAHIYYVSIIKNVAFKDNEATYTNINNWVKTQEGITFIDVAKYITKDASGTPHMQWFASDGLHPSVDGYAVFHREIATALGLNVTTTGNGLGDTTVTDAPAYLYTAGWKYDATTQIWHNEEVGKAGVHKLMISEAYADTLYAEAKVSVAGMYQGETGGKGGLAISSPTVTYFFYINLAKVNNPEGWKDNWGAVAYRPEVKDGKNWVFPEGTNFKPLGGSGYANLGEGEYDYNVNPEAYKTLGVGKFGKALYFFSGGKLIGRLQNSLFAADEKVTVSVFNFNTNMYAKEGSAIVGAEAVKTKLETFENVVLPTELFDGSLDNWTEAEKPNPVVFTGVDGRKTTIYAAMGDDGVKVFYEVSHKNNPTARANWWENTNIEFFFGKSGGKQYYATQQDGASIANYYFETVKNGDMFHTTAEAFIPYTDIEGYDANSAYIPAGFAFKSGERGGTVPFINGDYWKTDCDDPVNLRTTFITKNGISQNNGTDRTIDGQDDWTEAMFTSCAGMKAGATAEYAAHLGQDGLYMIFKVKAVGINIQKTDSSGWHLNTNFEIFATDQLYAARIVTFGGKLYYTGCIDKAAMTFTAGTNNAADTWTVEFFIANEHMKNAEAQSVTVDIGGQLYATGVSNSWQEYGRGDNKIVVSREA